MKLNEDDRIITIDTAPCINENTDTHSVGPTIEVQKEHNAASTDLIECLEV